MDPERWQLLEPLLDEALELPVEEHEDYLVRVCGDDAELRSQLRELIAECREDSGFLEQAAPAAEGARQLALEQAAGRRAAELLGQRLGPYRIVRVLGEGGLSTVYLGERSDQRFSMRVAVKVVKRGMDSADILRRLRQERRILAGFDHPNIARLLDGGTTGDGRPYFVMEHIEGEPIDEYCDRRKLGVAERLELFPAAASTPRPSRWRARPPPSAARLLPPTTRPGSRPKTCSRPALRPSGRTENLIGKRDRL